MHSTCHRGTDYFKGLASFAAWAKSATRVIAECPKGDGVGAFFGLMQKGRMRGIRISASTGAVAPIQGSLLDQLDSLVLP